MKKLLLSGLIGMTAVAGSAHATSVGSQLFNGFQQWSDNSAEILVNHTGGATTLDVGDELRGIFNIQTVEQSPLTHDLGTAGVNELTGVFDIVVTDKSCIGSVCSFDFGAGSALSWLGAGTAMGLFESATVNYSRLGSSLTADFLSAGVTGGANMTGLAADSSVFMSLNLSGASDFWNAVSLAGDKPSVIGNLPDPGNGGIYNLGLSIGTNNSGKTFSDVSCFNGVGVVDVNVCGSGSLLAKGGVTTPFDNFDNVDFAVNVVPEPNSLAVFALGLLGLGLAKRRTV